MMTDDYKIIVEQEHSTVMSNIEKQKQLNNIY